jgi:hypothetical protein
MDELLKAILLAAVSDKAMKDMEQPVILAFEKEKGLISKATTKIKGPKSCITAGCTTLLTNAINTMHPECKAMQKETLEMIYKMVAENLALK